jgi:hypothetical protein
MLAPSIMLTDSRESDTCIGLPLEVASTSPRSADEGPDEGSCTAPDSASTNSPQHRSDLEERVQELEEKLATLSLLLKGRSVLSISPPSITPPQSPPRHENGANYLNLESPAAYTPPRRSSMDRRRHNLSFRVLHSPDSPGHDYKVMHELAEGMYLPEELHGLNALESSLLERHTQGVSPIRTIKESPSDASLSGGLSGNENPLPRTELLLNNPKSQENSRDAKSSTDRKTAGEKGDNVKSKWLDYLNSFQESHYDTDKQMEEFVRIPSAVEALLSFGFWICVDSFLYILTILPIRFVWSSLLLARFLAIRMVQKKVPEGPFRFHRRYE